MADLREIEVLITNHINAVIDHERLFNLNDWGLATDDERSAALDPIDVALVALCAARPSDAVAAIRRAEYLNAKVPDALSGRAELTKVVVSVLVGDECHG